MIAQFKSDTYKDMDHPFLRDLTSHTITIGSPALYPAKEPRRLGCCESSGGSLFIQSPFLKLRGSFLINPLFLQYMPDNLRETPCQGYSSRMRAFVSFAALKQALAVRRGAHRDPCSFYKCPSQPFVAHGEEPRPRYVLPPEA